MPAFYRRCQRCFVGTAYPTAEILCIGGTFDPLLSEPAALKNFLKGRLAGFEVPEEFIVVDNLPKNRAGMLLKRELKKQYR